MEWLKKIISPWASLCRKYWKCLLGCFLLDYWTTGFSQVIWTAVQSGFFLEAHCIGTSLPGSPHSIFTFTLTAAHPNSLTNSLLLTAAHISTWTPCNYLDALGCACTILFLALPLPSFGVHISWDSFWAVLPLPAPLPQATVWCVLMLTTWPSTLSFCVGTKSGHWILDFTICKLWSASGDNTWASWWFRRMLLKLLTWTFSFMTMKTSFKCNSMAEAKFYQCRSRSCY